MARPKLYTEHRAQLHTWITHDVAAEVRALAKENNVPVGKIVDLALRREIAARRQANLAAQAGGTPGAVAL